MVEVIDRRPWIVAAMLALVVGGATYGTITHLNVPGQPDQAQCWGLRDFAEAVYFPAVAFLHGVNPYDATRYKATYPVANGFPPYSPLLLIAAIPFALLPLPWAEWLFFGLTVLLEVLLAHLALRFSGARSTLGRVLALAAVVHICRPGHLNAVFGQVAGLMVLGSMLAIQYARRRPWVGGLGLAIAMLKPTFGAPLAFLMLCRSDWRAVGIGVAVTGVGAAIAVTPLVSYSGGVPGFLAALGESLAAFGAHSATAPFTSPMRVDAVAVLARLLAWQPGAVAQALIAAAVLLPSGIVLWRSGKGGSRTSQALQPPLICLAVLLAVYHFHYDALLLIWPLMAAALPDQEPWAGVRLGWRVLILAMMAVPWINWLTTNAAYEVLHIQAYGAAWTAITAASGIGLLGAWIACLVLQGR